MKKVLFIFALCIILIGGIYLLKASDYKQISGVITYATSTIFGQKKAFTMYTNEFKINKLSMSKEDYYFNKLTEDQKIVYSDIASAVKNFETEFEVTTTKYSTETAQKVQDDIGNAIAAFYYDHPEVFYTSSSYKITNRTSLVSNQVLLNFTYFGDKSTIENQINDVQTAINNMLVGAPKTNDFENELYLHDALGKVSKYHSYTDIDKIEDKYHNSYSAIVEHEAVCDGFARAMQLLLDKVGIESIMISGVLDNQPHAWNLVKLDNEWYHLDLTSNKFIKEIKDNNSIIVHSYFNTTDSAILKSHKIDNTYALPAATGTKYNYYTYMNFYISESADFDSTLTSILNKQSTWPLVEFSTGNIQNVPEKMSKLFYKLKFNGYGLNGNNTLNYYNLNNSYVVLK